MKKTLIALMALAGVAMAETPITFNTGEFNWSLGYMLDEMNYTTGDSFVLEFKVDSFANETGLMMTLGENYYMKAHFQDPACRVGLSYTDASSDKIYKDATTVANPAFTQPSVSAAGNSTITWNNEGYLYSWITTDPGATRDYQKYIDNAKITISTDGVNSCITLAIKNNGPVSVINLTGVVLDANAIALNSLITSASGTLSVDGGQAVAIIPEPATATLSLLALAGLAARRRRK